MRATTTRQDRDPSVNRFTERGQRDEIAEVLQDGPYDGVPAVEEQRHTVLPLAQA